MKHILLLCRLGSLLACADKNADGQPSDSGAEADSGAVYPGGDTDLGSRDTSGRTLAAETCNGVEDDCAGDIDEAEATGATVGDADEELDGYGDPSDTVNACAMPEGYVTDLGRQHEQHRHGLCRRDSVR